jgi:uridine kinase
MKEEGKHPDARFILSICGPSGAGKSQLAKMLASLLGAATCARVPTDYYLLPAAGPLESWLRQPVYYDWLLLDRDLSVPDGITLTTPDFDFESFVRRAERGGRSFRASSVMVLDGMYPYPGADAAILLQVPSPIRKARIHARDQGWGTEVAARWEQLEQSRIYLEALSATSDLVLEGTDDLSANAATVAAFITSRQKRRSGLLQKGAGDIA